ncbi:MAG: NUDIX hydrolase [Myxococcales bacterium]|nr:NUDIX hydrolase [Myxococcales bacterium]
MPAVIHAAGVYVRDGAGRVLAFRRAASGRFGLPFGLVDPGEDAAQAATRECREETGYAVRLLDHPPFVGPSPSGKPAAAFAAQLTGERTPPTHPDEGAPAWVTPTELLADTEFPDYLRAMFRHFQDLGPPP